MWILNYTQEYTFVPYFTQIGRATASTSSPEKKRKKANQQHLIIFPQILKNFIFTKNGNIIITRYTLYAERGYLPLLNTNAFTAFIQQQCSIFRASRALPLDPATPQTPDFSRFALVFISAECRPSEQHPL